MMFKIRALQTNDLPALAALWSAAEAVDRQETLMTLQDLETWIATPYINAAEDLFVAEIEGALAGMVGVECWPGTSAEYIVSSRGIVHPAWRRRGLGQCLLETAEARARQIVGGLQEAWPRYFHVFARSDNKEFCELLYDCGLEPARYFHAMIADLSLEIPPAPAADGLPVRTYRPEDSGPVMQALNDAFRDHWGAHDVTLQQWEFDYLGVPHFRPDLWFLALDSDDIAGVCLGYLDPTAPARTGRKEGVVAEVGVRKPWRRRGLASALVTHTMTALKAAGAEFAVLGVDAENPHRAGSIYERLGFKIFRQNTVYRKLL